MMGSPDRSGFRWTIRLAVLRDAIAIFRIMAIVYSRRYHRSKTHFLLDRSAMAMELHQLRDFIEVAKLQSFTRAG
jgi:hypothetical protein